MRQRVFLAAILVALVQTGAIGGMVANRALHLAHGREILLDVVPVDPRDLLRGDFVQLNYSISRLRGPFVHLPQSPENGMPIFVTLERQGQQGQEKWVAVAASGERPALAGTDSKVVLVGTLQSWYPSGRSEPGAEATVNLKYGIESYFLQEGTGRDLERLTRAGAVKTIVSVDKDGKAAIKGISVEGKRYGEGLF